MKTHLEDIVWLTMCIALLGVALAWPAPTVHGGEALTPCPVYKGMTTCDNP